MPIAYWPFSLLKACRLGYYEMRVCKAVTIRHVASQQCMGDNHISGRADPMDALTTF